MATTNFALPYPSDSSDVDVAADIQALAEGVDTALYGITHGAFSTKTGSYTAQESDNGTVILMNVAGANNFTVPAGLSAGWNCVIIQIGAGQTTIVASGTTVNATPGLKLRAQHSWAAVLHRGSNVHQAGGDLSA